MRILKTILPVLLIAGSVAACSARSSQREKTDKLESKVENKKYVIPIGKDEFNKRVADLSDNTKEWKYLGDKPSIIDFYADWCVYCRKLAPVLEELAAEYDGKIYIYKVDTEKEREIAAAFGVRALPTLLFIPINGEPQVAQGAVPKEDLKRFIDSVLLK
jgi:thioredoxin